MPRSEIVRTIDKAMGMSAWVALPMAGAAACETEWITTDGRSRREFTYASGLQASQLGERHDGAEERLADA